MARTSNERWADNSVQFARLLAEISGACALTREQSWAVCDSMSITEPMLNELFDRTDLSWEKQRELVRRGEG